jgi:hypothetical protein
LPERYFYAKEVGFWDKIKIPLFEIQNLELLAKQIFSDITQYILIFSYL